MSAAGTTERPWYYDSIPFLLVHVVAVAGLFVFELTWTAAALVLVSYAIRMFGITAGFHRYFSHRAFKAKRWFQFVLGLLGSLSVQRSVLWWSGHHVDHHKYSDTEKDIHSPKKGFIWSHVMWMLVPDYDATPERQLRAFGKYPEIMWLHRYWLPLCVGYAALFFFLGGWSWLYWGFFVSTVFTWHGTFTINSLSHVWGSRRYKTSDTSRNNLWLSLITFGEGWHNNHHHYPSTANQGFFWWEIDVSYYVLRLCEKLGWVWDLRTPPKWVLEGRARKDDPGFSALVHPPAAAPAPVPAPARRSTAPAPQ
jgi:stearoyl-CoA desaturase (delta-9 desaturase)